MTNIDDIDDWPAKTAYERGEDPVSYAEMRVTQVIDAHLTVIAARIDNPRAFGIYSQDVSIESLARRVLGRLLDFGWTAPDFSNGDTPDLPGESLVSPVILRGDAACLPLPDASVDLIVTSPPYFGLRSYTDGGEHYAGQIGSEATPGEFLSALWACTREWIRVLKPQGSLFVNLGDKYAQRPGQFGPQGSTGARATRRQAHEYANIAASREVDYGSTLPKSLLGLPWRYAIGCIDELGLILRRDNIWDKTNPMPESVTDRSRTTHEYLFHLAKQERYFTAMDEVREPHSEGTHPGRTRSVGSHSGNGTRHRTFAGNTDASNPLGKLPGSVWGISSVPLIIPPAVAHARCCGGLDPGCEKGLAHHAAYPPELCRRIILGWSPSGICTACGEGRRPVAVTSRETYHGPGRHRSGAQQVREGAAEKGWRMDEKWASSTSITGYACACPEPDAPTRRAVVADPFDGTGTTILTADVLGRIGVGVDKSMDYCRIAQWRTADPGERARALGVPKPPPVPEGQGSLFDAREVS